MWIASLAIDALEPIWRTKTGFMWTRRGFKTVRDVDCKNVLKLECPCKVRAIQISFVIQGSLIDWISVWTCRFLNRRHAPEWCWQTAPNSELLHTLGSTPTCPHLCPCAVHAPVPLCQPCDAPVPLNSYVPTNAPLWLLYNMFGWWFPSRPIKSLYLHSPICICSRKGSTGICLNWVAYQIQTWHHCSFFWLVHMVRHTCCMLIGPKQPAPHTEGDSDIVQHPVNLKCFQSLKQCN